MRDRLQHRSGELEDILAALRRCKQTQGELEFLRMELRACLEQREEIARSIPSRAMDGMPRGKGGRKDPTLRAVEILQEQFHERETFLLRRIRTLMMERDEIERAMQILGIVEEKIVRMRWMQRKSWVQIGFQLELSDRQCQRIHLQALKKMAQLWAQREQAMEAKEKKEGKVMSLHVG